MKPQNPFEHIFKEASELPFLFVGAGISRRYLGFPDWKGLLREFANKVYPGNPLALEVFTGVHDDVSSPAVASRIQKEYDQVWLTAPEYEAERDKHADEVRAGASPFKLSLAEYFRGAKKLNDPPFLQDELSCLTNVGKRSVAGIITTNYDNLLEEIFKDYATFIGQEQLLFADTQGINEIYKIHGCCTEPDSIVINTKDYDAFNKRNAYLAAKLLTVFVEHPIIFLGYSISDPNVQSILAAITDCLSQKNLAILKKRLIFVEFTPEEIEEPVIREHTINFDADGRSIELTRITLNKYLPLYSELLTRKYSYNPKLLRQLKRDIYQLVSTNEPVDRFAIEDIEDGESLENYGVLAGIGVTGRHQAAQERGHRIPDASELFRDIIFDDGDFDLKSLVENALAKLLKSHSFSLPLQKYIHHYREQFGNEAPADVLKHAKTSLDDCLSTSLRSRRSSCPFNTIEELNAASPTDEKKIELYPLLTQIEDTEDELGAFIKSYLSKHPDALTAENGGLKTNLKRLIKIYDYLVFGKEKGARNT
jgi:hypothetical protein